MSTNATTSQPVTAVDELREAARLMRERAEKATPGPWFVTSEAAQYGGLVAEPTEAFPYDAGYAGHLIGESMSDGNRDYVASAHPGVMLAVADWLDGVAEGFEGVGAPHVWAELNAALSVARVYLGRTR